MSKIWTPDQKSQAIENSFDVERLAEFWTFIFERQEIYDRRFVQGLPKPWTTDEVLQHAFFTNVYRELDVGTQYLLENIIDHGSDVDELFEILVYRLFNNRRTYEAMRQAGRAFGSWDRSWAGFIRSFGEENGVSVFCEAHMTNSYSRITGLSDKLESMCLILKWHYASKTLIHGSLMSVNSLKELCEAIAELDGFGSFLAYEVATDMGYSPRLAKFTEDDWTSAGPGCRRGIDLLLPSREQMKVAYDDVIQVLRDNQRKYFSALDLDFKFLDGRELSLRNVEHSLCEYSKYHRAKHTGVIRRKYENR